MARILVVEDEPDIAKLIARILELRGHAITIAADGEAALAAAARVRPALVLLDLNLPKMDGLEVCRRLKASPETRDAPVVMLTAAYVSVDDAARGLEAGAAEYIVKPFLREVLIHNVERLLASAR